MDIFDHRVILSYIYLISRYKKDVEIIKNQLLILHCKLDV